MLKTRLTESTARIDLPETNTNPGNWNKAKRVKVMIEDNLEIDDVKDVKISHELPSAGGVNTLAEYLVTVPDVTLKLIDTTHERAGFHSLGDRTLLVETGKSESYTIRPVVRPTQDVTVTLESSDITVATIDTDRDTARRPEHYHLPPRGLLRRTGDAGGRDTDLRLSGQ